MIPGYTEGSLAGVNAGLYDAFVRKYDGGGNLLWTRQIGTSGNDFSEVPVAATFPHSGQWSGVPRRS